MTPLPPVPDVARVQALWDVGTDSDVSTTTYWSYTGGSFSSGNAADMAGIILAAYGDGPKSAWDGSVKLVGCRVTDLASDTAGDGTATTDVVGTRAGTALPAATCAVANYTIDRRYRGGKPKGFLPFGVAEDLQTEQTWSEAALTDFLSAWQQWFTAVNGAASGGSTLTDHISVSYYAGFTAVMNPTTGRYRNVPKRRPDGPVTYAVIATEISTVLGSQRRRNRG